MRPQTACVRKKKKKEQTEKYSTNKRQKFIRPNKQKGNKQST